MAIYPSLKEAFNTAVTLPPMTSLEVFRKSKEQRLQVLKLMSERILKFLGIHRNKFMLDGLVSIALVISSRFTELEARCE